MDEISTKYILFAVSLFVIVVILSSVISSYSSVQDVYKIVKDTNISIKDRYDSLYYTYHGAVLNGVDLVNTIKRFEDDNKVMIYYPGKNKTPPSNEIEDAISVLVLTSCTESEYLNILLSEDVPSTYPSLSLVDLQIQAPIAASLKYRTAFDVKVDIGINNTNYDIIFTQK